MLITIASRESQKYTAKSLASDISIYTTTPSSSASVRRGGGAVAGAEAAGAETAAGQQQQQGYSSRGQHQQPQQLLLKEATETAAAAISIEDTIESTSDTRVGLLLLPFAMFSRIFYLWLQPCIFGLWLQHSANHINKDQRNLVPVVYRDVE